MNNVPTSNHTTNDIAPTIERYVLVNQLLFKQFIKR